MKHTHISARRQQSLMAAFAMSLAILVCTLAVQLGSFSSVEASNGQTLAPPGTTVNVKQNLSKAIEQRDAMLQRRLAMTFVSDTGKTVGVWNFNAKDYPQWIVFEVSAGGSRAVVSTERVIEELDRNPIKRIDRPDACTVLSTSTDTMGVERATTDCVARPGYVYESKQIAAVIKRALETKSEPKSIEVQLAEAPGSLNVAGETLTLLGAGKSDFGGSGVGRKANVRKALGEHLNNVIVPPGVEFSYNSVLGKSISTSNGWQMALTIFNGKDLEMAPGGGVCQSSTTMFRALLNAGFPIVERKSHSLYVHYYEKHGVGLDATIFPGKQDLTFINDTGHPVVVQSYYEGDEAFVNIYGVPDSRRVALEGPYFGKTAPKDLLGDGKKPLRANQIAWIRRILPAPGADMTSEVFVSNYTAVPRSLADAWPLTVTISGQTQHAAAPDEIADAR